MDYPLDIKDYAAFIVWIGGKKKIKTELWLAFDWFLEKKCWMRLQQKHLKSLKKLNVYFMDDRKEIHKTHIMHMLKR